MSGGAGLNGAIAGSPYRKVVGALSDANGGFVESTAGADDTAASKRASRLSVATSLGDEASGDGTAAPATGPAVAAGGLAPGECDVRAFDVWYWDAAGCFIAETMYYNALEGAFVDGEPRLIISLSSFQMLSQAYVMEVEKDEVRSEVLREKEDLLSRCRVGYFKELQHLRDLLEMARQHMLLGRSHIDEATAAKMERFRKVVAETEVYYFTICEYIEPELKGIMVDAVKQFHMDLMRDNFELRDRLALYEGAGGDEGLAEKMIHLLLNKGVSPAKILRTLAGMITDKHQSEEFFDVMREMLGISRADLDAPRRRGFQGGADSAGWGTQGRGALGGGIGVSGMADAELEELRRRVQEAEQKNKEVAALMEALFPGMSADEILRRFREGKLDTASLAAALSAVLGAGWGASGDGRGGAEVDRLRAELEAMKKRMQQEGADSEARRKELEDANRCLKAAEMKVAELTQLIEKLFPGMSADDILRRFREGTLDTAALAAAFKDVLAGAYVSGGRGGHGAGGGSGSGSGGGSGGGGGHGNGGAGDDDDAAGRRGKNGRGKEGSAGDDADAEELRRRLREMEKKLQEFTQLIEKLFPGMSADEIFKRFKEGTLDIAALVAAIAAVMGSDTEGGTTGEKRDKRVRVGGEGDSDDDVVGGPTRRGLRMSQAAHGILEKNFDGLRHEMQYSANSGRSITVIEADLELERKRRIQLESEKQRLIMKVEDLSEQATNFAEKLHHLEQVHSAVAYKYEALLQDATGVEGCDDITLFCRWINRKWGTLQNGFNSLDIDRDGTMSYNDFCAGLNERGWVRAHGRRLFDAIDIDTTGMVTFENLLAVYKRYGEGKSAKMANAAMAMGEEEQENEDKIVRRLDLAMERIKRLEELKAQLVDEADNLQRKLVRLQGTRPPVDNEKVKGLERKMDSFKQGIESVKAERDELASKMTAAMWKCREACIQQVKYKREAETKTDEFNRLRHKFEIFKATYRQSSRLSTTGQPMPAGHETLPAGGFGATRGMTMGLPSGGALAATAPGGGALAIGTTGIDFDGGAMLIADDTDGVSPVSTCAPFTRTNTADGTMTREVLGAALTSLESSVPLTSLRASPAHGSCGGGGGAATLMCPRCNTPLRLQMPGESQARGSTALLNNFGDGGLDGLVEGFGTLGGDVANMSPADLIGRMSDDDLLRLGAGAGGGDYAPGAHQGGFEAGPDRHGGAAGGGASSGKLMPYRARIAGWLEAGPKQRYELLFLDAMDRRRFQETSTGFTISEAPAPQHFADVRTATVADLRKENQELIEHARRIRSQWREAVPIDQVFPGKHHSSASVEVEGHGQHQPASLSHGLITATMGPFDEMAATGDSTAQARPRPHASTPSAQTVLEHSAGPEASHEANRLEERWRHVMKEQDRRARDLAAEKRERERSPSPVAAALPLSAGSAGGESLGASARQRGRAGGGPERAARSAADGSTAAAGSRAKSAASLVRPRVDETSALANSAAGIRCTSPASLVRPRLGGAARRAPQRLPGLVEQNRSDDGSSRNGLGPQLSVSSSMPDLERPATVPPALAELARKRRERTQQSPERSIAPDSSANEFNAGAFLRVEGSATRGPGGAGVAEISSSVAGLAPALAPAPALAQARPITSSAVSGAAPGRVGASFTDRREAHRWPPKRFLGRGAARACPPRGPRQAAELLAGAFELGAHVSRHAVMDQAPVIVRGSQQQRHQAC